MAKCVFCGEKAAVGKTVYSESFNFRACPDCYARLKDASNELIQREAYMAGIYDDMDALARRLLDKKDQYLRSTKEHEDWVKENACGTCPKCGGTMTLRNDIRFMIYLGGLPTTNISQWNTSDIPVEVHTCQSCGYMEMYSSDVIKGQKERAERAEALDWLLKEDEQQDD